jgi:hypothetical protein
MIIGSLSGWLMFAGITARPLVAHEFRRTVLANRDELHLGRDLAAPSVVHLRHVRAGFRAAGLALRVEAQRVEFVHRFARDAVHRRRPLEFVRIVARLDPSASKRVDAGAHVDRHVGIGERAAGIVHGMNLAGRQLDGARRNADRRLRAGRIHFARRGKRFAGDRVVGRSDHAGHTRLPNRWLKRSGGCEFDVPCAGIIRIR